MLNRGWYPKGEPVGKWCTNLRRRKRRTALTLLLPGFYFFVVTSSRCPTLSITNWECTLYERDDAWQRCDNKKSCCHAHKSLSISIFPSSVTTWQQKSSIFLGGEKKNTPSTLSVRHRRCRKQGCLPLHGFTLTIVRVSPAVTHGAPPPEAVLCVDMDVDAEEVLWVMSAYCLYLCSLFLLSFNIYIFALFKSFFIFADV